MAVYWMAAAWNHALANRRWYPGALLTVDYIIEWGMMVDPYMNKDGIRKIGVYVNTLEGRKNYPPHEEVPRLLKALVASQDDLTPEEFYKQFEGIHPFGDGNGRTGKIVYNWLKDTLHAPIMPPDFFGGISNP